MQDQVNQKEIHQIKKGKGDSPFFLFAIEFSFNLSMFADSKYIGLWQLLEKLEKSQFSS